MGCSVVKARIRILATGTIRKVHCLEYGFTLLDTLVATVILGMVAIAVWHGQSTNYGALQGVNKKVHMVMAGTSTVAEIECGFEVRRESTLDLVDQANPIRWNFFHSDGILEVNWVAKEQGHYYQIPGFFILP